MPAKQAETYYHPETGEVLSPKHTVKYNDIPTMQLFFRDTSLIRSICGPAGSGKTLAATMEILYRIPRLYWNRYGLKNTRWAIVRNTQPMLRTSTQKTIFDKFPPGLFGDYNKVDHVFNVRQPYLLSGEYSVTLETDLEFMSCDRPEDIDKFKGLEITGYLIDESCEVSLKIKTKLKERIGRYPSFVEWNKVLRKNYIRLHDLFRKKGIFIPNLQKMSDVELREEILEHPEIYQTKFGIEVTNPPHIESDSYWMFNWKTVEGFERPGPVPVKEYAEHHTGFWQPPFENEANLTPGYYQDMRKMYKHAPDHIERYIMGEPGVDIKGQSVYHNFVRAVHESKERLVWDRGALYRGWDHTGNSPACVVAQLPFKNPRQIQILSEFFTDAEESMVDFGNRVKASCHRLYPGAEFIDWGDPAGSFKTNQQRDGTRK